MSCYEEERASFVIPASAWEPLKARLRQVVAAAEQQEETLATRFHEALVTEFPDGLPGDWHEKAEAVWATVIARSGANPHRDTAGAAWERVLPFSTTSGPVPTLQPGETTPGDARSLAGVGCTVSFDDAATTLEWEVPENNHAPQHARASVLGAALFRELDAMAWTPGTGGEVRWRDEHAPNEVWLSGKSYGQLAAAPTFGF